MLLINSATTKDTIVLLSSKICDTCVDIPSSTDMSGSLYIALPATSLDGVQTLADLSLICPLHGLSNNCVNLSRCDGFDSSMYKGSLTICKDENMGLNMCFHNVARELNGTKLYFFYSNLQCAVHGRPVATRRYTKSVQLVTEGTGIYLIVLLGFHMPM